MRGSSLQMFVIPTGAEASQMFLTDIEKLK
jgi:hypothetical protein